MESSAVHDAPVTLPRIAIVFCTQCKWMLRAAYFAQELLSTFSTTIGEVALVPSTGGIFQVKLTYKPHATAPNTNVEAKEVLLWDRKAEGGFPETKVLKQRVRDHLDPNRDLGHSDAGGKKKAVPTESEDRTATEKTEGTEAQIGSVSVKLNPDGTICQDCN